MNLDDRAWDKACEDFNTAHPTPEQVRESYQLLFESLEDEHLNYHNQDGEN